MDLIERLRAGENFWAESSLSFDSDLANAVQEAADEIERRTNEAGLAWSEVEKRDAKIQLLTKERDALAEELRVERLNHGYLRERFDELHTGAVERLRQLQATIKERDALRLDAERYRWLRDESQKKHDFYSDAESWMVSRQQGGMGQNFFGAGIDAAIDAAMKAKP